MDNNYNGIVLYQIDPKGNLKGVHTNEFLDGTVNVEIATKESNTILCSKKIIGIYHSTFFKGQLQIENVKLNVRVKSDKKNTFHFLWTHNNNPLYKGIGYMLSQKQMVVHLWVDGFGGN